VVSNGFPDVQYRKLETLQIRECFDCIVLSEAVGVSKPEPAILQHAASLLKVEPSACLYVGDLFDMDVVGAKQAGMLACWFNPSGAARPRHDIAPDLEIQELAALLQILRR
jgi:putative hydrolase of the HAD superfamily